MVTQARSIEVMVKEDLPENVANRLLKFMAILEARKDGGEEVMEMIRSRLSDPRGLKDLLG